MVAAAASARDHCAKLGVTKESPALVLQFATPRLRRLSATLFRLRASSRAEAPTQIQRVSHVGLLYGRLSLCFLLLILLVLLDLLTRDRCPRADDHLG